MQPAAYAAGCARSGLLLGEVRMQAGPAELRQGEDAVHIRVRYRKIENVEVGRHAFRRGGLGQRQHAALQGKAEAELGWKAEYGIKEMCADSWKWQSQNPDGYDD